MTQSKDKQQDFFVYIGTYTEKLSFVDGRGEGIYLYSLDVSSGRLTPLNQMSGIMNPSYLAIAAQQRYLYSVQETGERDNPAIHAFKIEPEVGTLQHLNQQPAHGDSPCHLTVDQTEQFVVAANYGTGTISVYPILDNGQLGAATDVVRHQGSSINRDRQEGPHAHAVAFDPDNRYVFISDLGLDKIMVYRFDSVRGKLQLHDPPFRDLPPGAGPRHFTFHPKGRYAFVINELDATMTSFSYYDGTLTPLQTLSTLPAGFEGEQAGAAIRVAPSGRFVYGSNRGHDSIAIFAFDEEEGRLTALGHESTQGQTPRDFALDPSGRYLFVANQDTDTVVTFLVDQQTGQLQSTGQVIQVPSPVCIALCQIP